MGTRGFVKAVNGVTGLAVGRTLALVVLAITLVANAYGQIVTIGLLAPDEEPRFSEIASALTQGLREQGHSEHAIQIREGRVQRGDSTAARAAVDGFLRQRASVIFAVGSVLARIAREAAPAVAIVFITPGDPVAAGLVASLARPGGNMTAMTFEYPELSGKRIELLKEIVPHLRRVLVLYDPRDDSSKQGLAAAREAAAKLKIMLLEREVRSVAEIRRGLMALKEVGALLAIPGGITSGQYEDMTRAANANRRPTIFHARTDSSRDALLTYGARDAEVARQAARLVDKILKGANAGDLPVERPTRIPLTINLKTAKSLGLTIPPSVLLRADEVVQ